MANVIEVINESDIPFEYYSNPVKISNSEFVVCLAYNKELMKYNIHSKEWSKYFNYDKHIEEKLEDWSTKTEFRDLKHIKYISYKDDNGSVILGDLVSQSKDKSKIFVHFGSSGPRKNYQWIELPCIQIFSPTH